MTSPEDLRADMVALIKARGLAETEPVERALRTVPRHEFVPAVSPEQAYDNTAITIKPGPDRPASCASVPTVVAAMLDQLDVQPGHRVLEIGAGTGYNAALLAELTGKDGHVTTIDIQSDVTDHARDALNRTGYTDVEVVTGDGALGVPDHAPYDRIIVTVGPWDVPPAWFDQLTPGGRLVVPLHWRGQARSVAFVAQPDGHLRSDRSRLCGFIPMIGIVPAGEHNSEIAPGIRLHYDRDQQIDPELLTKVFTGPVASAWSTVTVEPVEPFDGIWVTLTGTEPGTCRLDADEQAVDTGICTPAFAGRSPVIVDGDSLAYLTTPRLVENAEHRCHQLGALGHGPCGAELAQRLCAAIETWGQHRTSNLDIRLYRDTPPTDLPGIRVPKEHTTLVVTR